MIPRLAALSIAEISVRTCSGLGVCAERTVFCIVRRRVTTLRLCSDRFTVWRARLAADFVFAIVIKKVMDLHARQRIAIVNPEGFSQSGFTRRRASGASVQGLKRYNRLFSSASLFAAEQRAPHPFAFLRPKAQRRKLEQKLSGPGSEVLYLRLRGY